MKKAPHFAFLLVLLHVSNAFTQNDASLVNTRWLFNEARGMAISFEVAFKANGKAFWKGTNTPNQGTFSWYGDLDDIEIKGDFGSESTITLQGSLTTGILSYSSPWWLSNGKSGVQSGRYKATQILSSVETPVFKLVELNLANVFMGECGNDNHCHHEPVAGYVEVYLLDRTTNEKVISEEATRQLYQNPSYNLICDNYNNGTLEVLSHGDEDRTPVSSGNIMSTLNYMVDEKKWKNKKYTFVINFTFGCQHRDNFLASLGAHWLTGGDNRIEDHLIFSSTYEQQTIGPYNTPTNRCHQYWLQFNTRLYSY